MCVRYFATFLNILILTIVLIYTSSLKLPKDKPSIIVMLIIAFSYFQSTVLMWR